MKTNILNYILNKFCPILVVAVLSFAKLGFNTFEPYVIVGMMIYASYFSYKVGYAMGLCESRGLM